MHIQCARDAHEAGTHRPRMFQMQTAKVEDLPIVRKLQRRRAGLELGMKNGVILEDEHCRRVAPLGQSQHEPKREAVRALRESVETFTAAQALRIDRWETLGGHARASHASL